MVESNRMKRRGYMVALGTTALSLGSSLSAARSQEETTKKKAEEVHERLRNGNFRSAKKLLDDNNIDYFVKESEDSTGDISTQDSGAAPYPKSSSSISMMVYNKSGNTYEAFCNAHLNRPEGYRSTHAVGPVDPIAITYAQGDWQAVSQSESNFNYEYQESSSINGGSVSYENYTNYGVLAQVDEPVPVESPDISSYFTVSFWTDLERIASDDTPRNVNGEYAHSYQMYPGTFTFSIGPGGLELGGSTKRYRLETTEKA